MDGIDSFTCVCEEGFTGILCETGKALPFYRYILCVITIELSVVFKIYAKHNSMIIIMM